MYFQTWKKNAYYLWSLPYREFLASVQYSYSLKSCVHISFLLQWSAVSSYFSDQTTPKVNFTITATDIHRVKQFLFWAIRKGKEKKKKVLNGNNEQTTEWKNIFSPSERKILLSLSDMELQFRLQEVSPKTQSKQKQEWQGDIQPGCQEWLKVPIRLCACIVPVTLKWLLT